MSTEKVGLSKGEQFKKDFGMSRTMHRNMKKSGVASIEEYRTLRKERRKKAKIADNAKRDKIKATKKVKASTSIKKK